MTPMYLLSEFARSLFSLWSLIICLNSLFSLVRSVVLKRLRYAALALVPFACSYFLWQVLFDVHMLGGKEGEAAVSAALCSIPFIYWILMLLALTAAALVTRIAVNRYGRNSVTPDAVKQCLDRIPCGVCCFGDDGRVLFSNVCMNRLCVAVTGERLSDGRKLSDAANGLVVNAEGRKWRFTASELTFDGEKLHELIASDVTAEYAKTEALQKDKEELSTLNRKLKEYMLGIDESVRRREILQAKVNIHDEMNRLMLSTAAVASEDSAAEERIFSLWEQNALLLCMEADRSSDSEELTGIEKLGEALKVTIVWKNELPESLTDRRRELFFSAAKEAVVNAAKHAGAKQVEISFSETDDEIRCSFANDGKLPDGKVKFAGGLSNLSLLAKRQGGSIETDIGGVFKVSLVFPKNT